MIDHPDKQYTATILDIIKFGAKIGYVGPKQRILSQNLPTAQNAPDVLTMDLETQLAYDRVTRLDTILEWFISSPLGLVPKSNGKWRRIHHLSYPLGKSVNCHIKEKYGALEYTSFDEAVALVIRIGRGAILIKKDLADAFRHIPVAESDWLLLGFSWEEVYFMERFLPFGLQTSPYLFDLFAKGLNWMLMNAGWQTLHYLDDFLGVLESNILADKYEIFFSKLCRKLGFRINKSKNIQGTLANFLGIEIDTMAMEAQLPADKLLKARTWVKTILQQTEISQDELQSLLGFLSFAAKVIVPGRIFLWGLFDTLRVYHRVYHLNAGMKADLKWWDEFLPQ